jgi:plasmid stabilization system protein ParE
MNIAFNSLFEETLVSIIHYIMKDSVNASIIFEEELFEHLADLTHFPYKFRESLYYEDEQIRDYIFKDYTIPYLIDEEHDVIVILDIFKWVEK